jgi:hypothetical protein
MTQASALAQRHSLCGRFEGARYRIVVNGLAAGPRRCGYKGEVADGDALEMPELPVLGVVSSGALRDAESPTYGSSQGRSCVFGGESGSSMLLCRRSWGADMSTGAATAERARYSARCVGSITRRTGMGRALRNVHGLSLNSQRVETTGP